MHLLAPDRDPKSFHITVGLLSLLPGMHVMHVVGVIFGFCNVFLFYDLYVWIHTFLRGLGYTSVMDIDTRHSSTQNPRRVPRVSQRSPLCCLEWDKVIP